LRTLDHTPPDATALAERERGHSHMNRASVVPATLHTTTVEDAKFALGF
jgi:hypothetical protein